MVRRLANSMTDPLIALAEAVGLQPAFIDTWGKVREVSRDTIAAALEALGFDGDPSEALAAYRRQTASRLLPAAIVLQRGHPAEALLTLPAGFEDQTVAIQFRHEDGRTESVSRRIGDLGLRDVFELEGERYERRSFDLPKDLPLGYHRLGVTLAARSAEALVISAPEHAWSPWRDTRQRLWGIAVQLYAVRSSRNWGIGDFTDLAELTERAAAEGVSAVGINPLHALFPDEPERVSPYSPSTRLYRNPLYLDVEAIPDFARAPNAQELVYSYEFQRELGVLRGMDTVAYAAVAALKFRVLRLLFAAFERSAPPARRRAFSRYRAKQGQSLHRLATYERLRELRSAQDWSQRDWRNWPREFQDPDSEAVAAFAEQEADAIRFGEYLQWQIDEQLSFCLGRARQLGLPIGLYADLAVGVDAGGAEAWWNQKTIVRGLTIGAPPDLLNTQGQGWGLPLFSPVALAEQAFEPFIAVLKSNMRHAGAIRIDHILGLMRLWCIPEGRPPSDGAYITYPVADLIAIVALESHRHRCLVIGEDLGTLPPGLSDILAAAGILSYRVLYFERSGDAFRTPEDFKRDALITIGTHDLPPLARWWHGNDLTLRAKLGHLTAEALEAERRQREADRAALARWAGLENAGDRPPVVEIHRNLARAPSFLLMVQPEDMLPEALQVNVPGTYDEHPNWRHKLGPDLSALFADRLVLDTLGAISAERRPPLARLPARRTPAGPEVASPPRATYRLQFHAGFSFADAERLIPYLDGIGISHVYASSFFRARPGSSHGYDITDHAMLNPEIGTEESFASLTAAMKAAGIGLILDFVPNHMGIGRADNGWWLDVLEWGLTSPYAKYFDIDWRSPRRLLRGKVLLPFLGDQYGAELEAGRLQLRFDAGFGTFSIWYGEHRFPIRPADYPDLLRASGHKAAAALAESFADLPSITLRRNREAARLRSAALKQRIVNLAETEADARARIDETMARINGEARFESQASALHRLIERQHYRLAFWRVASDEINYRRFFDINELAGIRVEDGEVFATVHRGIARLLAEDAIHGIRLDHIDGLAEPVPYLRRLRAMSRRYRPRSGRGRRTRPLHLIVEKILGHSERLRSDWPVAGTTGYEFANLLAWLYVDPAGRIPLDALYAANGGGPPYETILHTSKMLVMDTMLASEIGLLAERLDRIAKADLATRDFSTRRLRAALAEITAGMDVYRTYIGEAGIASEDRRRIAAAVARARRRWRGTDRSILDFVERVLTGDILRDGDPRAADRAALVRRFQQYTGPVMAKSLEDTAFYRYNRLIALNEVGGDPTQFGISVARFHEANLERALRWPDCMLATSTHDTKRGEDARLRIAALSEMAADWTEAVQRWHAIDRRNAPDEPRPEPNDVYLIYQTLIGSWPAPFVGAAPADLPADALAAFRERVGTYAIKAVREAKLNTSWTDPDENYEAATIAFIDRLLDPARPFLGDFIPFQARVSRIGAASSVAQLALKLTVPGIPDIYQGSELWNFSMADPDNRRPVDYRHRESLFDADRSAAAIDWSAEAWRSGGVKLSVTRRLLTLRRALPELFARGVYRPLEVEGGRAANVVVFLRRYGDTVLLVAAGRLMKPLLVRDPIRPILAWKDAVIRMPPLGVGWEDVLTGRQDRFGETVPAAALMGDAPTGIWIARGDRGGSDTGPRST